MEHYEGEVLGELPRCVSVGRPLCNVQTTTLLVCSEL